MWLTERSAVLSDGSYVTIESEHSREVYFVRDILTGEVKKVSREDILIPTEYVILADVSAFEVEEYADGMGFVSATDWFLLVDISRQRVYVLKRVEGKWRLVKNFLCSTGAPESPTVKGHFKLRERGEWFYSYRLGSGGKWWIRFSGSYLFHGQATDKERRVLAENNAIGERVSNGCVRLFEEDVKWIFFNVPDGSGVFVR